MENDWKEQLDRNPENEIPNIKDYVIWMAAPILLSAVTCGVGGLVLIVIWAFSKENPARSNYFKAMLIIYAAGIAISMALIMIAYGIGMANETTSNIV